MKKNALYTALVGTVLLLSACGGDSDNDTAGSSTTKPTVPDTKPPVTDPIIPPISKDPNKDLTVEEKKQVVALVNQTSTFSLKEILLNGMLDSAVYGTDEAFEGTKCSHGSLSRVQDTITFKNCEGLFEEAVGLNQYGGLKAVSGSASLKNGVYEYKDLVLANSSTGESKTINGKNTITDYNSGLSSEMLVDQVVFNVTEKRDDKYTVAEYVLKDYKLNYDKKSATSLSLASRGTLTGKNSAVGNFNIQFKTTQALLMVIDPKDDDAVISYPYAGTVEIVDLTNKLVTTYQSNSDKKTILYSLKRNGKEIDQGTKLWSEVLGYAQ